MTWKIEYRHFYPTLEVIQHLKTELEELIEKSPYASFTKLILTQEDDHYHGHIEVNSTHRKFRTAGKSRTLTDLAGSLLSEMNQQISEWKFLRAV